MQFTSRLLRISHRLNVAPKPPATSYPSLCASAAKKLVVSLPQSEPQQQPDWDPCESPMGFSPLGRTLSTGSSLSPRPSLSPKQCGSPEPQQSPHRTPGRLSTQTSGLRDEALDSTAQQADAGALSSIRPSLSSIINGTAQADTGLAGSFRRSVSSTLNSTSQADLVALGSFRRSVSSTLNSSAQTDVSASGSFRRSASSGLSGSAQQQRNSVAVLRNSNSFIKTEQQHPTHFTLVIKASSNTAAAEAAVQKGNSSSSRPASGTLQKSSNNSTKLRVSFVDEEESADPSTSSSRRSSTEFSRDEPVAFSDSAVHAGLFTILSSSGGGKTDHQSQHQQDATAVADESGDLFGNLGAADSALDFLRRLQSDSLSGCYSPTYHRSRSANLPVCETAATTADHSEEQSEDFKPLRRNRSQTAARPAEASGRVSPTAAAAAGGNKRPPQLHVGDCVSDMIQGMNSSSATPTGSGSSPKSGIWQANSPTAASPTRQGAMVTRLGSKGSVSTASALASAAAAADSVLRRNGSTGQVGPTTTRPLSGQQQQQQMVRTTATAAASAATGRDSISPVRARVNSGLRSKAPNNHRTGYKTEELGFRPHDAPVSLLNERVSVAASELDSTRYDKILGALHREQPSKEPTGTLPHWNGK